jgi:hypothetical protein
MREAHGGEQEAGHFEKMECFVFASYARHTGSSARRTLQHVFIKLALFSEIVDRFCGIFL